MLSLCRLSVAFALLTVALPSLSAEAREGFAAVTWRTAEVALESESGERRYVRFRRIGIEYWEGVARGVQAGFSLGYSESDARSEGAESVRPVETIAGNFGSLGMRFQVPLTVALSIEGGADYLFQRDLRDLVSAEIRTRSWETRAEAGLVWRMGPLFVGGGVNWRDIDFREIRRDDDAETVRHSGNVDSVGGFAQLGVYTDASGSIAFRYDGGAEEGWSLHFTRRF